MSAGVIRGNIDNPMRNLIFENVVVNEPGKGPENEGNYLCSGVSNFDVIDGSSPIPDCASVCGIVDDNDLNVIIDNFNSTLAYILTEGFKNVTC